MDPNCEYNWCAFEREFHGKSIGTQEDIINRFIPQMNRVFAIIATGVNKYAIKIGKKSENPGEWINIISSKSFISNREFYIFYNHNGGATRARSPLCLLLKKIKLGIRDLITEYREHLRVYSGLTFEPENNARSGNSFDSTLNLWPGYAAQLITPNLVSKLYDLIRTQPTGDMIVAWFRNLFEHPERRPSSVLIFYSAKRSILDTLTYFFQDFLFGRALCKPGPGKKLTILDHTGLYKSDRRFAELKKMMVDTTKNLSLEAFIIMSDRNISGLVNSELCVPVFDDFNMPLTPGEANIFYTNILTNRC